MRAIVAPPFHARSSGNAGTSTTSLKLPDVLKKRIAALVEGSGRSAHAFMVEAIARETERAPGSLSGLSRVLDPRGGNIGCSLIQKVIHYSIIGVRHGWHDHAYCSV